MTDTSKIAAALETIAELSFNRLNYQYDCRAHRASARFTYCGVEHEVVEFYRADLGGSKGIEIYLHDAGQWYGDWHRYSTDLSTALDWLAHHAIELAKGLDADVRPLELDMPAAAA